MAQRLGGRLRRLIDGVEAEGWRFVALMRLVPLVPFNLLNYALGLTRISLSAYVLASAVCMLPGAIAYTWLGYAGRSAAVGRYFGTALWTARSWSARHDRLFAPPVPPAARPRTAWIESAELQRRLAAGDVPFCSSMFVSRRNSCAARASAGRRQCAACRIAGPDAGPCPRKQPIVVVCKTDRRSARAATELLAAGLRTLPSSVAARTDGTAKGWRWSERNHPSDMAAAPCHPSPR